MANVATIEASVRGNTGTGAARAVRREDMIPCIVYGGEKQPASIQLDRRVILKELETEGFLSRLYNLNIDGKAEGNVIPRAIQFHPVTDVPMHVDFMRVIQGATVHVSLPVHFENEDKSPGIKRGGMLNIVTHELEVECLVTSIPEYLAVSVAEAEIGDSIHLSQIHFPEGVRPLHADRDSTIASVMAPSSVRSKEAEEAKS